MKKKVFGLLAATLAGSTLFLSACSAGDSKIVFKNYWNYNTESTSNELIEETLRYEVSFLSYDSGMNYALDYEGTYETKLVSKSNDTYEFTSTLDLTVSFTVNGQTEEKQDTVKTYVHFYKAGGTDNLRPISSWKKLTSHTPVFTKSASSPKDCYLRYDYEFETTYENGQGSCEATRYFYNKITDKYDLGVPQTYTFSASSSKRSVLDNEQFPVAFRAMPAGTNTKVQMFNPYLGHSQNYVVKLSGDTKEKKYEYTLNETAVNETIKYNTASIIVDGTWSGQPQWAEIASLQDPQMNRNRNIMLYYCAPLDNNIGAVVYKLKSAKYSKLI